MLNVPYAPSPSLAFLVRPSKKLCSEVPRGMCRGPPTVHSLRVPTARRKGSDRHLTRRSSRRSKAEERQPHVCSGPLPLASSSPPPLSRAAPAQPRRSAAWRKTSPSSAEQTATADSRHIATETYWQEPESAGEEQEERQSIDELQEAGLSTPPAGSSSEEASPAAQAPPPAQALLAALTRRQTRAVQTRLRNYTRTLKSTRRQAVTRVKDIFAPRPPESR